MSNRCKAVKPPIPPACGKNRYASQSQAIASAIRSSKRGGTPLRVYRCPDCKGWHLTKRRNWHAAS